MIRYDVLGLGLATLDILTQTPRLPASNEVFPIDQVEMQGGGPTATALVALARLGARTAFLGPIAPDETGKQIKAELQAYGVDTSHSPRRADGVSPVSVVLVERTSGQRAILYQKGTAEEIRPDEIRPDLLASSRALHLDGVYEEASLQAARAAREAGVLVSFDGGAGERVFSNLEQLLPLVDLLVVAREFAWRASGKDDPLQAGPLLLEKYRSQQVVITDGEAGCWYWDGELQLHQPAYQVKVVDTTGAGDTFHGAYLFACLQEAWSPAFRLKFASAVAAIKCTQMGGRKGIPTLTEALDFLSAHGDKP
jgi:sulfofructose kinase